MVLERTKLFNEIVEYEEKHIINKEENDSDEFTKPSPKDIYKMHNLYLKEITDLIIEKVEKLIKNSQSIDTDKVKEIISQTIDTI